MNRILIIIYLLSTFTGRCYTPGIFYEWFSLGGGFIYSMEDQYTGLNGKINLPLGSHAKFVMQATLFPEQLQDPSQAYNEARAKFNVEFTPIKIHNLYVTLQTGFDFGYWQRTYEIQSSTLGTNWKRDESMMFGGILNYDFHRFRAYIDYMYMPEIFSNHIGIGITMLFFEDNQFRRLYFTRKKIRSSPKKSRSKKSKASMKNNA